MTQRRVCIFFDGANFNYLVLKKLRISLAHFDFCGFVNSLVVGDNILQRKYYLGTVSKKHESILGVSVDEQVAHLNTLDQSGFVVFASTLRHRLMRLEIDERVRNFLYLQSLGLHTIKFHQLREKGIDVKIATDLLVGAYKNEFDEAIIVSSDTDLIPAIMAARKEFKKVVTYIGFSVVDPAGHDHTVPTRALMYSCDQYKILTAAQVRGFLKDVWITGG